MTTAVLTIDDISSANTPKITDYLSQRGICAVMFAVGENVQRHYDEAVYAVKKGMIVGNHSWSHISFSSEPFQKFVEEIEKTENLLDQLYKDACVPRRVRPFRFPYGDKGREENGSWEHYLKLQEYLKANGFSKLSDEEVSFPWYRKSRLPMDRDAFWTFDFLEYMLYSDENFTAQSVFDRMLDPAPAQGGALLEEGSRHIVLMHAHDETEAVLPEYWKLFLEKCMALGVRFVKPEFV